MDKDLPKVYANRINKKIDNDQEVYYENINNDVSEYKSIRSKINEIFSSRDFVYKKDVEIITSDSAFNTTIIGTNNGYLLTMDNKSIDINDIKDIKIKNM